MCCDGLIDKFPQVDNCCCCFKVKTGSKIIAWLGMIATYLYTIVTIVTLVRFALAASTTTNPEEKEGVVIAIIVSSALELIVLVFHWAMDIVLLIGLYKEDMGKVRLWLRVNICLFFFGAVRTIMILIIDITTSNQTAVFYVTLIIDKIIQILIFLYMITVVKSHYHNKTQQLSKRESINLRDCEI